MSAWLWLREKLKQLLSDQGPVPEVSNTQLFMFMYPRIRQEAEAAFLIGNYMELVDTEVVTKQKESSEPGLII